MSDLFIGSNYRPNRPEAINFKPVNRPGTSPSPAVTPGGGDQFIKSREKNLEKLFGEKHNHEKRSIEKEKEKITFEKDKSEKGCFEKNTKEKQTLEKDRGEKGCFEKRDEKVTKEKNTFEKSAEKAIWPPEGKGGKLEKDAEKMSIEKRIEKCDEKFTVEKHTEKGDAEKMNVEKRSEKWLGEKHLEIDPVWLNAGGGGAVPSERFFYK